MTRQLAYAAALGLLGAAIVHILVLLLVPAYSERDAWSRISAAGELFSFVRILGGAGADTVYKGANPFVRSAACRFEIDPGIVHIRANGAAPLWTAAIFDRTGQNVYSLSDRTTVGQKLDVVIATPVQMIELRKDTPEIYAESVFVELDAAEGMAVIRVVVPDGSWNEIAEAFLAGAQCRPAE